MRPVEALGRAAMERETMVRKHPENRAGCEPAVQRHEWI